MIKPKMPKKSGTITVNAKDLLPGDTVYALCYVDEVMTDHLEDDDYKRTNDSNIESFPFFSCATRFSDGDQFKRDVRTQYVTVISPPVSVQEPDSMPPGLFMVRTVEFGMTFIENNIVLRRVIRQHNV